MKDRVFEACLSVIEKESWKAFSFAKASQHSGIPLYVFHSHFSSPSQVITYLFEKIDKEVLKNRDFSVENLSPKDALFEIIMARFDAAEPFKPILRSFWQDWILMPEEIPSLACHGFSSMAWMLEAANLNRRGPIGFVRIQGLTAFYLLALQTWISDDSLDMGKTMVFLDKGLSTLEKAATFLRFSSSD
ncbi:MAG: hypothetical protein K2P93_01305 [Alphaproteobacteria bacterium]|nr:hypothetical protein [Alphaproteobacteria bacterium]